MTKTATMNEFFTQSGKSLFVNSVWIAASENVFGISDSGSTAASASVLKAVAMLMRNGKM